MTPPNAALLLGLLSAAPGLAAAPPVEVIYDGGQTIVVTDLLGAVQKQATPPPTVQPPALPDAAPSPFPVTTTTMQSGALERQVAMRHVQLPTPIFLVGTDQTSRAWLTRRKAELQQRQAVGMVVQALSEADYRVMLAIAYPLPLGLGSADVIAQQLGLTRYPLLIDEQGRQSQ